MINAKGEFLDIVKKYKVIASNITIFDEQFKLRPLYSDEEYTNFLNLLDIEYDSGFGTQHLFGVIYCEDGVWMQRNEYDGSEWWEIYSYPSLLDSFDKSDVIKYERYVKLKNIQNV